MHKLILITIFDYAIFINKHKIRTWFKIQSGISRRDIYSLNSFNIFQKILSQYSHIVGLPKICQKTFYRKRSNFVKYYIWEIGNNKCPISTFWDNSY